MDSSSGASLSNLFLGLVISSGCFGLPSYANPISGSKSEDVKAKVNPTSIAQSNSIKQVQVIGNTVLNPEAIAQILQPI
jgi:hypothetical protein